MRLHKLRIEGFRRLNNVTVEFGETTFCIGTNNAGKSSVLKALEYLLSDSKKPLDDMEYSQEIVDGEIKYASSIVILEAEFRNVSETTKSARGFKGRTYTYATSDNHETGISIHYKKEFPRGEKPQFFLKQKKRKMLAQYAECKTLQDLIDKGIDEEIINTAFSNAKSKPKLTSNISKTLDTLESSLDEIWDFEEEDSWFENAGGIPQNVLSRLPRFLSIPIDSGKEHMENSKSTLSEILNALFQDVRNNSEHYQKAQDHLNQLAQELDPNREDSKFGEMMSDINRTLQNVFPDTNLHVDADLSDPNESLKPKFGIEMSSNIKTPLSHQGTGMIRAAAFNLLRFHKQWRKEQDKERATQSTQSLIIGFEEPEIYLHPSAANQMRRTIQDLSGPDLQIVATTHSPYLVNLAKQETYQVLNRFDCTNNFTKVVAFNITEEFHKLKQEAKDCVKMILRMDDYVSRAFFTKMVIIVEGDTEDIVIREALKCLPKEVQNKIATDFEVIKARGKASVIAVAKYFDALSLDFRIMHDSDKGTRGAERHNNPIRAYVKDPEENLVILDKCIEDVLGYEPLRDDKPYQAYTVSQKWNGDWEKIPEILRKHLTTLFREHIS